MNLGAEAFDIAGLSTAKSCFAYLRRRLGISGRGGGGRGFADADFGPDKPTYNLLTHAAASPSMFAAAFKSLLAQLQESIQTEEGMLANLDVELNQLEAGP